MINIKVDEQIKIQSLYDDSIIPEYKSEYASCMDLHAYVEKNNTNIYGERQVSVQPGKILLIKTGIAVQMPLLYNPFGRTQLYEMQVRSRSGLALKHGIFVLNSPGTVDSDFRGEIGVIICNLSDEPFIINHGDRIAQLALTKVTRFKWYHVDYLNQAQRDPTGFGTTGIK